MKDKYEELKGYKTVNVIWFGGNKKSIRMITKINDFLFPETYFEVFDRKNLEISTFSLEKAFEHYEKL